MFSSLFSITLPNIGKYFLEIHFPGIHFPKKNYFSANKRGLIVRTDSVTGHAYQSPAVPNNGPYSSVHYLMGLKPISLSKLPWLSGVLWSTQSLHNSIPYWTESELSKRINKIRTPNQSAIDTYY